MKLVRVAAMGLVASMVAAPMPAWAAFCANEGPQAPLTVVDDNGVGKLVVDVQAQADLDRRRLREVGVPVVNTERWNGCIRAFVEDAGGGRSMVLFDPVSLNPLR